MMKANQTTVLVGAKVALVSYRPEHVPVCVLSFPPPLSNLFRKMGTKFFFRMQKYHEWMCNEELRQLTASEPLTLEEEYAMQRMLHTFSVVIVRFYEMRVVCRNVVA